MNRKLGILGGGQLARMMLPTCMDWDLDVRILDQAHCVASKFCTDTVEGSFQDADKVWDTFKDRGIVTVDLESVSVAGLEKLESSGVVAAPSSKVLKVIQNKYLQKQFFQKNQIPTSDFKFLDKLSADTPHGFLKAPTGGYDGKGVTSWKGDLSIIEEGFKTQVLWEEGVDIDKEISVIVVRGHSGETQCYLPTEMAFDHELNLIAYTIYPARISQTLTDMALTMARDVCEKIEMVGVLAVEMFIDKQGKLLINELAPRPHNSGHHTIESTQASQFENHIRAVIGLPLGNTKRKVENKFALTFNIIGESTGRARWLGLPEFLAQQDAYVHNYGKSDCRKGRKMGHITLLDKSEDKLIERYKKWSKLIRVIGEES